MAEVERTRRADFEQQIQSQLQAAIQKMEHLSGSMGKNQDEVLAVMDQLRESSAQAAAEEIQPLEGADGASHVGGPGAPRGDRPVGKENGRADRRRNRQGRSWMARASGSRPRGGQRALAGKDGYVDRGGSCKVGGRTNCEITRMPPRGRSSINSSSASIRWATRIRRLQRKPKAPWERCAPRSARNPARAKR